MTLPDPFMIRAILPDFNLFAARYAAASDRIRIGFRSRIDVQYGTGSRECLDLFFPDNAPPAAPLHLFVHGGYWRAGRKEDYAFVAAPVLAVGGIMAVVEYDLLPGARMVDLVTQVRAAFRWLSTNATEIGADPLRITASGHSAGAHLASYLAARGPLDSALPDPAPTALLLVSGIYDLGPIRDSFLQPEIGLTAGEAADWSPIIAIHDPACNRVITLGESETAPFHDQAVQLTRHVQAGGTPVTLSVQPRFNHMDVVLALGDSDHPLGQTLAAMVADTRL